MIAVTGANGYVGGRLLAYLRDQGSDAIGLVRRPAAGDPRARPFALAAPLDPSVLDGVDAVVHAAYDLSCRGREVRAVNFEGSLPLLEAVASRGARTVLISSLSAFEGARSDYGQTKLALEGAVLERGGAVVRPGLVFGRDAGGLFGALATTIPRQLLTPLVGGGGQRLFVTHDRSLCELVAAIVGGREHAAGPLFAAHEVPTTLRAIAQHIADAHGRTLRPLPLPGSLVYLGLRCGESLRLPLPFRSDSVRSLSNPIPLDQASALSRATVGFPALRHDLWARQ